MDIVQGSPAIEVIDSDVENMPETIRPVRQPDIHPTHGVDDPVRMGEIDPGVMVDLHMGQILDRLHEQGWPAEIQHATRPGRR